MKKKPRRLRIPQIHFAQTALLFGLVTILSCMPLTVESAPNERAPLDLTILERQAELTQHMDRSDRMLLARIEAAITQAQSDMRSGEFMVAVEPSAMQPNRDVNAINAEGRKLIASAEISLYENQKALVELLKRVDTQHKTAQIADDTAFDLELEAVPYHEAIQAACERVMEACWQKGYQALFYHEVFINDTDGMRRAGSGLRNEIYDTLVAIDGTNFTLNLPIGLKLKADTIGIGENSLTFEGESAFRRDKKALLVIEVIVPDNSSTGLLSVRAINMATQRIAAADLIKITNFPDLLDLDLSEASADQAVQKIEVRGGAKNIEIVADLPEDYRFELQSNSVSRQSEALIAYTLFENSGLSLVDSDFIKAAYGADLAEPENWRGRANGRIVVAGNEVEDRYEMGLQVEGAERVLPAGTVTVFRENPESVSALVD